MIQFNFKGAAYRFLFGDDTHSEETEKCLKLNKS